MSVCATDNEETVSPYLERVHRELDSVCREEGRVSRRRGEPRECAYTWPNLLNPWLEGWDEQNEMEEQKYD